ncbi:MAG: chemotaxis protein CheB [bacterium]
MNILIVEDNPSSKALLRKIIRKDSYNVILCDNGNQAIEILKTNTFDVVLTDWMMPEMDGVELIQYIRKNIDPIPVLIVITALSSREAQNKAMSAGADDYISKPYSPKDVISRMETAVLKNNSPYTNKEIIKTIISQKDSSFLAVCVAASTGGPPALIKFFSLIKFTTKASYFVVLHAPVWMLESFTERLQTETKMKVVLGKEGYAIKPGEIYLAPGDRHMSIHPTTKTIMLLETPPENFVRPSADPLFKSIAEIFGKKTIGVVLTGMGHDGSVGCGYINAAGGFVIAQDPATALLSSMPKNVVDLRLAKVVARLEEIPGIIDSWIEKY